MSHLQIIFKIWKENPVFLVKLHHFAYIFFICEGMDFAFCFTKTTQKMLTPIPFKAFLGIQIPQLQNTIKLQPEQFS